MSAGAPRYCPICGATNPTTAETCVSCRTTLPAPAGTPALWHDTGDPAAQGPAARASNDTDAGRRYEPPPHVIRAQAFDDPEQGKTGVASGRVLPPARRSAGGRGGCVMGCLAFLIIGAVAAALVVLGIVRPFLQDEVGDELQRVVATQIVQRLGPGAGTPEVTAGSYVISADEINRELRQNADAYDPLEDPRVTIDRSGLELRFEAYGTESSYRGGVEVADGRIVLTDITASGIAGRVLPADDVRAIIERELNDYVGRAGLVVTDVALGEGTLTITTAEVGSDRATPAGETGTPAVRTPGPTRTPATRAVTPPAAVISIPTPPPAARATTRPTERPATRIPRPTETPENVPAGDGTGL